MSADQAQLFDLAEGRRRRDAGLGRVRSHEPPEWVQSVDRAIAMLATAGGVFTVEDVRGYVTGSPHHPNAWGARMNAARMAGLIVPCGVVQARRPERHANRMLAWKGAGA